MPHDYFIIEIWRRTNFNDRQGNEGNISRNSFDINYYELKIWQNKKLSPNIIIVIVERASPKKSISITIKRHTIIKIKYVES